MAAIGCDNYAGCEHNATGGAGPDLGEIGAATFSSWPKVTVQKLLDKRMMFDDTLTNIENAVDRTEAAVIEEATAIARLRREVALIIEDLKSWT
jgi:hypothetical protein